jgi:hypothetical protein
MKAQFARLLALVLVILTLVAPPVRAGIWLKADPQVLAMFTKKYAPEYYYEFRSARMEGEGKFRLYVNKEGCRNQDWSHEKHWL